MRFITVQPNEIELKYTTTDLHLTWSYIGQSRTHGDCYYSDKYIWAECLSEVSYQPLAIICLTENQHLPLSLHLSVLEVFNTKQNRGYGTTIMNKLLDYAKDLDYKTFTLQPHDQSVAKFYRKLGFRSRKIDGIQIMRKYL